MSLADWTGLTASIGGWLKRGDHTSISTDLITLFEADFNAEVRVRQMETETSLTISSGYLAHPTDWLEWKKVEVTVSGKTHLVSPESEENASDRSYGITSAEPYQFVVRGSKTYIKPPPDSSSYAYPTVYYASVPALTSSASTNWLLTRYPGAYLYGALTHAKAHFEDATWEYFNAQYTKVLGQIQKDSQRASFGKQALQMKPDIQVK